MQVLQGYGGGYDVKICSRFLLREVYRFKL